MLRRALPLFALALPLAFSPTFVVHDALADDDSDEALDEDEDEDEDEGSRTIRYRSRTEIDFDLMDVDADLAPPNPALLPSSRSRFQPLIQADGPASISATVGGAQDANFLDLQLEEDHIPRPEHFTAEGILSEHDLPVAEDVACDQLLCATGQAVELGRGERLLAQPHVDAIAQIGFSSGLDAESWQRPPLNIVAVVDTSGSMEGEPLATTKAALRLLVRRMERGDRMTLLSFDDKVRVQVRDGGSPELLRAIDRLTASNSTCVQCGLERGWKEALHLDRGSEALSRVVLFTDERPNVGTTSAAGFQRLLTQMAADDIGVTTIGVASHFGVELAQAVSTVRGANLYYFEDLREMRRVFDEELDTMLVPLAYAMELEIQPEQGWDLAGVYGLPGEALAWTRDGGIRLEVATLFPSRDKGGGIFLGFEQTGLDPRPDRPVASVTVRYETLEGRTPRSELALPVVELDAASLGLQRGVALVDAITTLKAATVAHHDEGDDAHAWELLRDLEQRLDLAEDPALEPEWVRVTELMGLIEPLVDPSERRLSRRDPVSGLPRR